MYVRPAPAPIGAMNTCRRCQRSRWALRLVGRAIGLLPICTRRCSSVPSRSRWGLALVQRNCLPTMHNACCPAGRYGLQSGSSVLLAASPTYNPAWHWNCTCRRHSPGRSTRRTPQTRWRRPASTAVSWNIPPSQISWTHVECFASDQNSLDLLRPLQLDRFAAIRNADNPKITAPWMTCCGGADLDGFLKVV
jgi:hypothetical protein